MKDVKKPIGGGRRGLGIVWGCRDYLKGDATFRCIAVKLEFEAMMLRVCSVVRIIVRDWREAEGGPFEVDKSLEGRCRLRCLRGLSKCGCV